MIRKKQATGSGFVIVSDYTGEIQKVFDIAKDKFEKNQNSFLNKSMKKFIEWRNRK